MKNSEVKQTNSISDHELLAALAGGDRRAFEIIYNKYAPELFRHIRRNIQLKEDCEEILQDVFEWLWRNRARGNIYSLWGYLYTAANSKVLMYFRKSKARLNYERHFRVFEIEYDYMQGDQTSRTIDPEAFKDLLESSLAKLPLRHQEAFRLRMLENLSNAEIAKRMNIKKDTVENYFVRVLSHLRESYNDAWNTH